MKRLHTKSTAPSAKQCTSTSGDTPLMLARRASHSSRKAGRIRHSWEHVEWLRDARFKRGLACDWNTTSGNGRSPWSCRIPGAIRRPQRGRVHRRSSPRRVTRRDYHANGAEERTRTSTSLRTHEPESCASANSATSAREERGEIVVALPPVKAGSSRVKQARGSLGLAQHSSGSDRLDRQLLSAV